MWTGKAETTAKMWTPPAQAQNASINDGGPAKSSAPRARGATTPLPRLKNQGKRIAQIVKLKPKHVQEYKEAHKNVWPEVLKQIKACNIEDYSIFLDEQSSTLFASFKYVGYDYKGDMERMKENEKVREWWKMTDGWQESLVEGAKGSAEEGGWWKGVEEVFYCP